VIRWSADPGQYLANSLSPARVEMVRLVDPEGHHAHVLVPPDQLSLAIGREGQNVRLAARLTGWKIDIKNALEYDQVAEDAKAAELIGLREEDERIQAEAEARLEAEQAIRAEEDARLRELYPPARGRIRRGRRRRGRSGRIRSRRAGRGRCGQL